MDVKPHLHAVYMFIRIDQSEVQVSLPHDINKPPANMTLCGHILLPIHTIPVLTVRMEEASQVCIYFCTCMNGYTHLFYQKRAPIESLKTRNHFMVVVFFFFLISTDSLAAFISYFYEDFM